MHSDGPGGAAHHGQDNSTLHQHTHVLQFTIPLSFFMGMAFTVFDAGFALKRQGSFVNGFTPLRAGVAGLTFSFKFSIPASLNDPDFFICSAANVITPSTAPLTSFGFSPVDSATALYARDAVIAEPAFIAAFIPFITSRFLAGMICLERRLR